MKEKIKMKIKAPERRYMHEEREKNLKTGINIKSEEENCASK